MSSPWRLDPCNLYQILLFHFPTDATPQFLWKLTFDSLALRFNEGQAMEASYSEPFHGGNLTPRFDTKS